MFDIGSGGGWHNPFDNEGEGKKRKPPVSERILRHAGPIIFGAFALAAFVTNQVRAHEQAEVYDCLESLPATPYDHVYDTEDIIRMVGTPACLDILQNAAVMRPLTSGQLSHGDLEAYALDTGPNYGYYLVAAFAGAAAHVAGRHALRFYRALEEGE